MKIVRKCTIEGCNEKHYGKGLCRKHYMSEYWKSNKKDQATEENRRYMHRYYELHPAKNHYRRAQGRCLYDKDSSYYQKVRFDLTPADVKKVWDRDNADQLLEPSIDRIDDSLGYIPNNIQFIELEENKRKPRARRQVIRKA